MINKSIFKLIIAATLMTTVVACSSDDDNDNTPGNGTGGSVDETGALPVILDRMGRPGVNTALIATDDDKDAYNLAGDPAQWAGSFTVAITERAAAIDSLDTVEGNALASPSALADLLVDDRLRIDTSVPECNNYLALELSVGGCGGRTLERDVIDDTLQQLVVADTPVSDLADNDSSFQSEWPFLGVAN
ncbi:DUF4331 family protein [Granulosicoccus antarcticus]|uniref:Uncharacterized protein n=1 Tax=Granulosicoccus antarcticus IMCC3135 TaxID=1192854 RepID=A0A2Z2NSP3_9GAMM|nr:DUF4331 family protein [Granulosicoccus antarcticus]ASJ74283.1 hypothetical protein IMCC3135_21030 [Granulosicoccus antarcticus IMCC3135]